MLRIMHRVCGPALPAALLLIGMSAMGITDAAAEGSPEARRACTPDAMRLCSEFTSDVSQMTKCRAARGYHFSGRSIYLSHAGDAPYRLDLTWRSRVNVY